jgi:hypothetical protein
LGVSTLGLAIAVVLLSAPWRAETRVDRPQARLDVDLGADVSLPLVGRGTRRVVPPNATCWSNAWEQIDDPDSRAYSPTTCTF